ncbi:hypothetical protein AH156_20125 [Salmonella enterica subsp. enterica serovar Enteritidis]|nr:hypothetical protein [Salmonella enterica subsp. enterica serovar Enteritidis]
MPVLFLKAAGIPRKIAGQAGYVKINGRWHKAGSDVKAPAGAPKAAHPEAAGKHKPYQMPPEQSAQLMYHPDKAAKNHEMKNMNEKHIPNLLGHAAAGDATAILGHKYGTNTHAKKLVAIANHLLEQMGSTHKVALGQQAGAHEAVSKAPEQPTEQQAEAVAKEAVQTVAEEIQKQPEPEAPKAEQSADGSLAMPAFMSGKQSKGVRTAYEQQAQKILDAVETGSLTELQALVNPTAGSWKGKTANSKMLLNFYGQALAKLQTKGHRVTPVTDEPSPVAAIETIASLPAQPKPTAKATGVEDMDWDAYVVPDNIKSSKGYNKQLDAVKEAAIAGDVYAILAAKYGTNTYAKKVVAAANLALTKLGHPNLKVVTGKDAVHPLLDSVPQPTAEEQQAEKAAEQVRNKAEEGPKNGDTRMGKNGMLVFQDGHWHKQGTDEVADKEAGAKLKAGSQVTFHQMSEVPPGSIVQCYGADGKPGQKFLIGHDHAWYIPPSGKPWKTPLKPGQYKQLMGLDDGYYPGETDHKYIGGYHALEHPTTIDTLGKAVFYTQKQKDAVKALFPGAEAAYNPGVFPAFGGKYLVIADPSQPSKGFAVKENGEPVGLLYIAAAHTDDVIKQIYAGQTPEVNLAARFGLATEPAETMSKAPFHPDDGVSSMLAQISDALDAGDHHKANEVINDLAEAMQKQPGSADSINVMKYLIKAKANALQGAGANKPEIPSPPAPEVEPQRAPALPHYDTAQEFYDWSISPEGEKWYEDALAHFGSDEALAASHEGQLYQAQYDLYNAQKKRKAAQEAKAAKLKADQEAAEKAQAEKESQAMPPKPKNHGMGDQWDNMYQDIFNAMEKGEIGLVQSQMETAKSSGSEGGKLMYEYSKQAYNWLKVHGPKEGDTKPGKGGTLVFHNGHWVLQEQPKAVPTDGKPQAPDVVSKTWQEAISGIESAMILSTDPDTQEDAYQYLQMYIDQTEGMESGQAQSVNKYAKDAMKWAKNEPAEQQAPAAAAPKALTETDIEHMKLNLDQVYGMGGKKNWAEDWMAQHGNTPEAIQAVFQHISQSSGYLASKIAKDFIKKHGSPEGFTPMPDAQASTFESEEMQEALAYAAFAKPEEAIPHIETQLAVAKQLDSTDTTLVQGYFHTLLAEISAKQPAAAEDNSLMDQMLGKPTPEATAAIQKQIKELDELGHENEGTYKMITAAAQFLANHQNSEAAKQVVGDAMKQQGYSQDSVEAVWAKGEKTEPKEEPAAAKEEGPQEGEMKPGKGGMLIFKDGHWVKAGPDDVVMPDFPVGGSYLKAAKAIHESFVKYGKDAGKGTLNGGFKLTSHKDGTYSFSAGGVNGKKLSAHSVNENNVKLVQMIDQLKASVGQKVLNPDFAAGAFKPTPKPKKTTPAAGADSSPDAGAYQAGNPPVDNWKQIGPQQGSNPGGKFEDEDGNHWYVKFPKDEDHAKSEVLAARLYEAMGIGGQDAQIITRDGKIGIASRWTDGLSQASAGDLAKNEDVLDGFAADAWLGNWDVVGATYDNLKLNAHGKAIRVDAGGSLHYRAQGSKKGADEFGDVVDEIDSMRSKGKNSQTASVFGKMTDADIAASVSRVAALSDTAIRQIVEANAPGSAQDRIALADKLIARKKNLLERFPAAGAKKVEQASFKVENLSQPPSFANWNGTGSGLSSKAFLNEANQKAVDAVYEAAKHGKLEDINNATAPIFDKETGNITQIVPLSSHPSQHVNAYWQDMVKEVDYQLNPPEAYSVGQVVTSESLATISNKLKAFEPGKAVQMAHHSLKMGDYVVLGKVGNITDHVPEKTNTKIGSAEWKDAAKQHYSQASSAAKAAFSLYVTSSGAAQLNTALRKGKLDEVYSGRTVAEHMENFKGLLVDIPEGSTFVRNMGSSGYGATPNSSAIKALQQFLMDAEPGTVVQEPGFSSTSWTGGNSILGNNDIQWNFTASKGVKMFPAWLTANKSEGEGLLPPNARYVITGTKKVGKTVVVEAIIMPTEQ